MTKLFNTTTLTLSDHQTSEVIELLEFNTDAEIRRRAQTYQAAVDLRVAWEALSAEQQRELLYTDLDAIEGFFSATPDLDEEQQGEAVELLGYNTDSALRTQVQTYLATLQVRGYWKTLSRQQRTALFEGLV